MELDLYVLLTDWSNRFKKNSVIKVEYNLAHNWFFAETLEGEFEAHFPIDTLVSQGLAAKETSSQLSKYMDSLPVNIRSEVAEKILAQFNLWRDTLEPENIWHGDVMGYNGTETSNPLDTQTGGTHYKDRGIQPIEYIMTNNLDFCQGNVIKYVTRHSFKNGKEDLEKAKHYIDFMIHQYEKEDRSK